MKNLPRNIFRGWFVTLIVGIFVLSGQAQAALTLTIDSYTTDEVTFTISGTFDADTIGDSAGYLAIKNDWSNNQGVHTEWFSTLPTVTLNTITIGGAAPATTVQDDPSFEWADNVFFNNPLGTETPILAGTAVAGSITLSAAGAFNPADAATLELVSGFVRPVNANDWARLEAAAAPLQGVLYRVSLESGSSDFSVYDILSDAWTTLTPFPTGSNLAASADGRLFGWNITDDEIQEYDPGTDSWGFVQATPAATGSYGNLEFRTNGEWVYTQTNDATLYYTVAGVWQTLVLPFSPNATGDYDPDSDTLVVGEYNTSHFHAIDMGTLAITSFTLDASSNGERSRCGDIRDGRFYYQTDSNPVRYLDLSDNTAAPVDVVPSQGFYPSCAVSQAEGELFVGSLEGITLTGVFLDTPGTEPLTGHTDLGNHSSLTWVGQSAVVVPMADLTISKLDAPDPVVAGTSLSYTIRVDNIGDAVANDVVVTDTLPPGVTLISTAGCAEDPSGVPTCSLGSIAPAGFAEFTVTVMVDPSTLGALINAATVATTSEESDLGNNSTTAETAVNAEADLSITKMDSSDPFISGGMQKLIYTIQVSNAGPSDATNVVVTDTLSPLAADPVTVGCMNDPVGVPDCQLGTIPAGGSAGYTITVTILRAEGLMTNTASVVSAASDPTPGNDLVDETTEVFAIAIPTLNNPGLVLLILLMASIGWMAVRRF